MEAKQMKQALVLGASGGVGGEVMNHLLAHGWNVRAFYRSSPPTRSAPGLSWIQGDAMDRQSVLKAAAGVDLIVHAVNPPGYQNWNQVVLPMLENTIAAAQKEGARILLPGTLYNYGEDTAQPLTEATPQTPSSRKGEIRAEMEARLKKASEVGAKVLIVRAGDFFGPKPGSSWFSQGMVQAGKPVRSVMYPGKKGVGHAWAYLPDLAETMVQLLEQSGRLADFETFHFGGHWDASGNEMFEAIQRVTKQPKLKMRLLPWIVFRVLAPFKTFFREVLEVQYLWRRPFRLENQKLVQFLGKEPHTPLDEAILKTLDGLKCGTLG